MTDAYVLSLAAEAHRLIDEIKQELLNVRYKMTRVNEIVRILRGSVREQPEPSVTRSSNVSPAQDSATPMTTETSQFTPPNQTFAQGSPVSQTPTTNSTIPSLIGQLEENLAEQQELKRQMRKYNRKLTWGIPSPIAGSARVLAFGGLAALVFASTTIWPLAAIVAGGLAFFNVKYNRKRAKNKLDSLTRENNALLHKAGDIWEQIKNPAYQKERAALAEKNEFYRAAIENEDSLLQRHLRKNSVLGRPKKFREVILGDQRDIRTL